MSLRDPTGVGPGFPAAQHRVGQDENGPLSKKLALSARTTGQQKVVSSPRKNGYPVSGCSRLAWIARHGKGNSDETTGRTAGILRKRVEADPLDQRRVKVVVNHRCRRAGGQSAGRRMMAAEVSVHVPHGRGTRSEMRALLDAAPHRSSGDPRHRRQMPTEARFFSAGLNHAANGDWTIARILCCNGGQMIGAEIGVVHKHMAVLTAFIPHLPRWGCGGRGGMRPGLPSSPAHVRCLRHCTFRAMLVPTLPGYPYMYVLTPSGKQRHGHPRKAQVRQLCPNVVRSNQAPLQAPTFTRYPCPGTTEYLRSGGH
ncbi:hypothetical protein S40288_10586 [Stachybotrys chartarum IBT 40288]|nr:hypothetical protein S40288_10586 [Stachybotrys chartarum IBT 40288]